MANVIEIIVRAKDEASQTLENVSGSMDDMKQSAQTVVVPMAAMAAAGGLIIGKMTMTAARTEELGVVVENLGRVTGYSKDELADVEKSIIDLGITTQGARTIMSRFMGAELDLADASKIARAAQDLAVIGMEDSSVTAENLTYALASMQPRVLRQYGLFLNLNDVYEETATALGKNVDELTDAEKRQGMLNALLEEAANFEGTYEAAMKTAGKQMRSFRRYTEELSNELGKFFLPILEKVVEGATTLIKAFIDLPDSTKETIAGILAVVTAIAGFLAGGAGLIILIAKVVEFGVALVALATGPIGLIVLAIVALIAIGVLLYKAWTENWGGIREKVAAVWEALRPIFETIVGVFQRFINEVLPALWLAFQDAWEAIRGAISAAWEIIKPKLDEMFAALKLFWEEMEPRLKEAWEGIQKAMEPVAEWIEETLIPKLKEIWEWIGEHIIPIIGDLAAKFLEFTASAAVAAFKKLLSDIVTWWDNITGAIGFVIDAVQDFLNMVEGAIEAWQRFTDTAGEAPGGRYGNMGAPGLQSGLSYVPATMPAVLHQGEAVLTAQQADVWRNQMNVNVGNVYGMDGFGDMMDQYWFRMGRDAI